MRAGLVVDGAGLEIWTNRVPLRFLSVGELLVFFRLLFGDELVDRRPLVADVLAKAERGRARARYAPLPEGRHRNFQQVRDIIESENLFGLVGFRLEGHFGRRPSSSEFVIAVGNCGLLGIHLVH
jgi:hypothetical protein